MTQSAYIKAVRMNVVGMVCMHGGSAYKVRKESINGNEISRVAINFPI